MLTYLEKVLACTELDAVWALHCEKMAEFGFDRLIYAHSRFTTDTSIGPREDALVLSNHDSDYFKTFMEDGHYRHAPLTKWAINNTGVVSWNIIGEQFHTFNEKQRRVIELNKAYGVNAGYTISFRCASTRMRGVAALTARRGLHQSDVEDIWAVDGKEIEVLCNIVHLKIMALPHIGHLSTLSKRQLEVLEWVGDGKTNQDIAVIMGLSSATIEKHLRLARKNMNVETTAQAVLKASFQNQMFVIKA